MALRWGFASSSRIAHDFINAIGTLNDGEHEIVAVADPIIKFAEDLAKQFDVPKFCDNFLELAQDSNVEIVHVGALNTKHFEIAKLMLEHGKHVLVEKPMCMNAKQVQKLISLAKQKNVFLMEGVWARFLPNYHYVRQQLKNGIIGDIQSIEIEFGNSAMAGYDRIVKKHLGGGITLDVGVYTIHFCQMILKDEPKSIQATGIVNDDGVDVEVNGEFIYSGNRKAKIRLSAINTYENSAIIRGTKGTLTVPNFIIPNSVIGPDGKEITFPEFPAGKFPYHYDASRGLRFEPDEIRKYIRAGKTECDIVSLNDSLIVARIEDEIRRQLGVRYPADDE
ncbi:trans-1,2-dihydrobenzene-1,2-diol dehydrogenase-like [Bradysia coprophila]|uniref:trans-1,2-dihydrobenzene-1,2-diol dehydrogenase-like n=1 Tax=Bradysia coprophila TaxID=38358 RepID=UPI00187D76E0|nr:trans-1,2-dihydrobenzene-1,2-diol dehydrogenase-like [Bradysia coprophila]